LTDFCDFSNFRFLYQIYFRQNICVCRVSTSDFPAEKLCTEAGTLLLHGRPNLQKQLLAGVMRNFPSPKVPILEWAEGVPVDPRHYRSRIWNRGQKIDCECYRHISTSGFPEIGHFYWFSSHCTRYTRTTTWQYRLVSFYGSKKDSKTYWFLWC